jgi:hypothetical protein
LLGILALAAGVLGFRLADLPPLLVPSVLLARLALLILAVGILLPILG